MMNIQHKNGVLALMASACLGPVSASANLLLDPGFELPDLGFEPATVRIAAPAQTDESPWTAFNTAAVTNTQSRPGSEGNQSLRLAPNAPTGTGVGIARQEFAAAANDVFTLSAWVFHPASDQVTGDREGQLRLQWLNANNTLINQFVFDVVDASTPTDQWIFVEIEDIALPDNANITSVRPSLFVTNDGGTGGGAVFFDDVSFTPILTAGLVGDYNGDGFVGQADLDLVLLNFGSSELPDGFDAANTSEGVFDGLIGQNELDDVLLSFGNGALGSGATASLRAVPEPGSLIVLGLMSGLVTRRRARAWR